MKRALVLTTLLGINYTSAFTQPASSYSFARSSTSSRSLRLTPAENNEDIKATFDPLQMGDNFKSQNEESSFTHKIALASTLIFLTSNPAVSNAAGPDWGLFEGRTGSLLHPAMMGGMFLFSISTGILGFQIRQTREIGNEISKLKKMIPKFEGSNLKAAIAEAEAAESVDFRFVESLKAAVPVQAEIEELTKQRKELVASGPRDKHFGQGALLAFLGTAFAIEVCRKLCRNFVEPRFHHDGFDFDKAYFENLGF